MKVKSTRSTFVEQCFKASFALLLLVITLIAANQILYSLIVKVGEQGDRAAWIGFWGNIAGGVLGLFGAVAAALTAVYVLREEMRENKSNKREALREVLEALSLSIDSVGSLNHESFEKLLKFLKEESVDNALSVLRPALFIYRPLDPTILTQVAMLSASVAIHCQQLDFQVGRARTSYKEIEEMCEHARANPNDAEYQRIALGAAGNLGTSIAALALVTAQYLRGLLEASEASDLVLTRAASLTVLRAKYLVLSPQLEAEGARLSSLLLDNRERA